ncbi:MAG: ribosome recycling factor [Candidatus Pacebacteria bacterium]|jgi:ribosome recycling factor|nr:ribosome recycling factor [Candidatus Paceibacterota bacterium]
MAYNFSQTKAEAQKIGEWLSKEYSQIHTGRASPALLDGIQIESYGSWMPIKNVSAIHIEDPKTLRVAPWDKSQVKEVERAIQAANLGLSVATDDAGLRVIFPMLTTERRVSLVKILKERLEDARVSVRKMREETWNAIQAKEKEGGMSEDEKFRLKDDLQKIVDETNADLESIFQKKENEVMN